jgi:hypothetical protein
MELRLPLLYRLKANFLLALGHDDWTIAEGYRHDAERVYGEIRLMEAQHVEIERQLVGIRERLDTFARDQITDDPRTEVETQAETSGPVGASSQE